VLVGALRDQARAVSGLHKGETLRHGSWLVSFTLNGGMLITLP